MGKNAWVHKKIKRCRIIKRRASILNPALVPVPVLEYLFRARARARVRA